MCGGADRSVSSLRTSLRLLRLDNRPSSACLASAKVSGCACGFSYGAGSSAPHSRHSAASRRISYTSSRRAPELCDDGAYARRVVVAPVHPRLLAPSCDEDSRGGLYVAGRGRRPTVAREHVCGPDVISTATVKGAREGARVEIMSVGCPRTAVRASRSAQASIPTELRASGSTV